MMRYHRVSSDILSPLSNGRKPISRTWKEEIADHSSTNPNHALHEGKAIKARSALGTANPSSIRDHQLPRISFPLDSFAAASSPESQPPASASATPNPAPAKAQSRPHEVNTVSLGGGGGGGVGGDVILQWGRRKRSRGARADHRTSADDASAHSRQALKIQHRSSMPHPLYGGARATLRTSLPVRDATAAATSRGVEDRSSGAPRSEKRSPPSPHRNAVADGPLHPPEPKQPAEHHDALPIAEKLSLDQLEWPKICISLSRTEKEDDFFTMKGTKLPQRPKKRAKIVDKNLQYCFPGMWLSDLTRGRYEVREKKCVKKRRRGLKGMENMDSESE